MSYKLWGICYKRSNVKTFQKVTSLVLAFSFAFSSPFSLAIAAAQTTTVSPTADQTQTEEAQQSTEPPAPTSGDAMLQAAIQDAANQGEAAKTAAGNSTKTGPTATEATSEAAPSNNDGGVSGVSLLDSASDAPPHLDREAVIAHLKPDQSGALGYQIPIIVPPGRRAMARSW